MSFGFPTNPSNKKQYVTTDGKSYEYDSTRGAWAVGIRPASSANTVNITDVSQLADPDNLLSNASSTLPVYATEESLYASTADLDVGQMAYVSENGKIAIWNGNSWLGATTIEYVPPVTSSYAWGGDKVVNAMGSPSRVSVWTGTTNIESFDINTTGNASAFGNLRSGKVDAKTVSNSTYAVFAGGNPTNSNVENPEGTEIDYVSVATGGQTSEFGTLTQRVQPGSATDGTYGVFAGGTQWSSGSTDFTKSIDYITIASPSNATNFGDLIGSVYYLYGNNVGDGTIGILQLGGTTFEYVTLATPSNATSIVGLATSTYGYGGASFDDATYGVFAGWNGMAYITISTSATASDFGNSFDSGEYINGGGTSNGTRGVICGGERYDGAYSVSNSNHYVTIATPGNSTDLGDLTTTSFRGTTSSGAAA